MRLLVGGLIRTGFEFGGDFAIGFEVFLLIKVHCKYYVITNKIIIFLEIKVY